MTKKKLKLVAIESEVKHEPGKYPIITFDCMVFNKEDRQKMSHFFENIRDLDNLTFHVEWDE